MVTTDVLMPVFVTRGTLEDELIRDYERMQALVRNYDTRLEETLRKYMDEYSVSVVMGDFIDHRLQIEKPGVDTG
ncbi:MAG: hypothetical protein GTO41_08560 [Burkholderiales bacterium]|nr:hypothetical protein [Burkholderiales bacterium]